MISKTIVAEKFDNISEYWNPKIAGEVNDTFIKFVKFKGEFVWHIHENEDEMFYVIKGKLTMKFRDSEIDILPGEFIIIPNGVEHNPCSEEEVHIMLIEPNTTLNTGNIENERTKKELDRI